MNAKTCSTCVHFHQNSASWGVCKKYSVPAACSACCEDHAPSPRAPRNRPFEGAAKCAVGASPDSAR